MRHVDKDSSTLTAEVWQEAVYQRPAAPEVPSCPVSRIARFFDSLAASMALQQRKSWSPCRHNRIVSPAEMLAQTYPQLYIQAMCS
jgi:hypothetical protein